MQALTIVVGVVVAVCGKSTAPTNGKSYTSLGKTGWQHVGELHGKGKCRQIKSWIKTKRILVHN